MWNLKKVYKWNYLQKESDSQNLFAFLFRVEPVAHLNRRCSCWPQPQPQPQLQQCQAWAVSATYTTAHSKTGSLTCWARPGVEPVSSWMLVRFVSAEPWRKLQTHRFWKQTYGYQRGGLNGAQADSMESGSYWGEVLPWPPQHPGKDKFSQGCSKWLSTPRVLRKTRTIFWSSIAAAVT